MQKVSWSVLAALICISYMSGAHVVTVWLLGLVDYIFIYCKGGLICIKTEQNFKLMTYLWKPVLHNFPVEIDQLKIYVRGYTQTLSTKLTKYNVLFLFI